MKKIDWFTVSAAVLVGVLVAAVLAGCGRNNTRPDAVNEQCDSTCRVPCDTTIPLWKPVDPNSPEAWSSYPKQVTIPLGKKLETCELARQECVKCLDRLKAAGVTR